MYTGEVARVNLYVCPCPWLFWPVMPSTLKFDRNILLIAIVVISSQINQQGCVLVPNGGRTRSSIEVRKQTVNKQCKPTAQPQLF